MFDVGLTVNYHQEFMDRMIEHFEEKEEYEKCTNLQKLKHLLFLEDK